MVEPERVRPCVHAGRRFVALYVVVLLIVVYQLVTALVAEVTGLALALIFVITC